MEPSIIIIDWLARCRIIMEHIIIIKDELARLKSRCYRCWWIWLWLPLRQKESTTRDDIKIEKNPGL